MPLSLCSLQQPEWGSHNGSTSFEARPSDPSWSHRHMQEAIVHVPCFHGRFSLQSMWYDSCILGKPESFFTVWSLPGHLKMPVLIELAVSYASHLPLTGGRWVPAWTTTRDSWWAPRFEVNKADTRTTGITVLVSGADGRSAPRRSVRGCPSPAPRAVLFYTLLEFAPGVSLSPIAGADFTRFVTHS